MITSLVAAVILAAAALWCLLRPAPGPRALLLAHQLDEAQRQADLEAAPTRKPPCPDCTADLACRVHDGLFWMALEQKEGLR